jgi:uncharacterized protein YndB with AHSA1/START domain
MTVYEKAHVSVPSDREVQVVRSFRAPRALVFRSYSEPALIRRWMLGPPGWTMPVCEMDMRVGGAFKWRWRSEDGAQEFGFFGVFREVDAGVRTVHTETFDPGSVGGTMGGGEAVITTTFVEQDGITTVTTMMDFGSRQARETAMATGMTDGMEQSHQRLDALLVALPGEER